MTCPGRALRHQSTDARFGRGRAGGQSRSPSSCLRVNRLPAPTFHGSPGPNAMHAGWAPRHCRPHRHSFAFRRAAVPPLDARACSTGPLSRRPRLPWHGPWSTVPQFGIRNSEFRIARGHHCLGTSMAGSCLRACSSRRTLPGCGLRVAAMIGNEAYRDNGNGAHGDNGITRRNRATEKNFPLLCFSV